MKTQRKFSFFNTQKNQDSLIQEAVKKLTLFNII